MRYLCLARGWLPEEVGRLTLPQIVGLLPEPKHGLGEIEAEWGNDLKQFIERAFPIGV